MGRRNPPKVKEISLKELLYKIRKTYDDAIDALRKEQEQKLREAIVKFCPLPKEKEFLVADYSFRGKTFQYKDFRHQWGDVILFGGMLRNNGEVSEKQYCESRINTEHIKITVPAEDK